MEALPIGNGQLGAMIFGGVQTEVLQLNEATLWSGGPLEWNNPKAREVLPKVREAIFAGDYVQAHELSRQMQGPFNQSYQPLGDLRLEVAHTEAVQFYERTLDLNLAVSTVRYRVAGIMYAREFFASYTDQLIVCRLAADAPHSISFRSTLTSLLRSNCRAVGKETLVLLGKAPSHVDPNYVRDTPQPIRYDNGPSGEGMTFDLRIRAIAEGGEISSDGKTLEVTGANSVMLLISAGISFNGFDKSPGRRGLDPTEIATRHLRNAASRSYSSLFDRHVNDYQSLFKRVSLDLGTTPNASDTPTDERVKRFAKGQPDPALSTLVFQYGRYLLISSSRPGGQPANLQGIWNDSMRPQWSANWNININSQMNYWPAEVTNLAECHQPFLEFIKELSINGRRTAEINYGTRGWCAHHMLIYGDRVHRWVIGERVIRFGLIGQ